VQDATGARIPSAKIVAQLSGSSIQREAVSEDRGEFRIDDLQPGNYRITITAAGFAPAQADVSIAVATVRDVTVTMKPAAAPETVNVQENSSSITTEALDTSSAVRGGVVGSHDLETLPLPARSFANIAYLVREPSPSSFRPHQGPHHRSLHRRKLRPEQRAIRRRRRKFRRLDRWLPAKLLPDDIQEFAVRTSNEDADTGWTTAGSVVITTKRGTNDWHGSGAFYDRQAALNARFPIENPPPNPKQPFSRQNYVGTFGGPIAKTKSGSSPHSKMSTKMRASPTAPPALSNSTRSRN